MSVFIEKTSVENTDRTPKITGRLIAKKISLLVCIMAIVLLIMKNNIIAEAKESDNAVAVRLAAGFSHSAMIDYDGSLYFWGDNSYGQLGFAEEDYFDSPELLELPGKAVEISLGAWHSLVLTEAGEVYSFGRNTFGQLGDGSYENKSEAVKIEGLPKIKAVAAGSYHSLALGEDGSVWGWGNNTSYQLAQSPSEELEDSGQVVARRVASPKMIADESSEAIAIAAGGHFSLYLDTEGQVFSWGDNSKGQAGNGTTEINQMPSLVSDIENITSIYAGYEFALAVADYGNYQNLYTWGDHSLGQLGVSDTSGSGTMRLRPARIDLTGDNAHTNDRLSNIAVGFAHVLASVPEQIEIIDQETTEVALVETGKERLLVWGNNSYGQLGLENGQIFYKPEEVNFRLLDHTENLFSPFDALAAGGNHSLVMSSTGQLGAAGRGDKGQLGTVSIIDRNRFSYVETSDHILPAWSENQTLTTDFAENNILIIRWPAAQDNIAVSGYIIEIKDSKGKIQILQADTSLERKVNNMDPEEAYAITVYAYDSTTTEAAPETLSQLHGYYAPENFDLQSWDQFFSEPLSGTVSKSLLPNNWKPDISGYQLKVTAPWESLQVNQPVPQEEKTEIPVAKIILTVLAGTLIIGLTVWVGINYHKQRRLIYPIPPVPEKYKIALITKCKQISDFVKETAKNLWNKTIGFQTRLKKIFSKLKFHK